ncbi:protein IQ-DOMAIN 3 [Malania oleifera]|uniref:protein IQ-DOMAIN 3 n=1 Tax=Malania oleifera TaxID=397392 RepID=UPI0025AE6006|nr:protein IQ-DOMAIN 3 [Malania oleifera]
MGKKGNWFSAVKKALSPESKEKKHQETRKSKKKWFRKHRSTDLLSSPAETTAILVPPTSVEEVKLTEAENEQSKHAYSVALATAVAAEAAVAAAHAAAEVVRLTSTTRFSGKSKEEVAAIRIQTAFRGYMARRALRALRGLVRLKSLIQGQSVKRQATTTLRCMQTLAHLQSQIRARRIRMSEENQALQRQLQQKSEKELEKLRASVGEEWDHSMQSREQIEASILNKQEAAMRRERALAYAFSHQQMWKNSSKSANPTFMDPNNPHWGWSWLERWMAARPWESKSAVDKELNSDYGSVRSSTSRGLSIGEITKAYSQRDLNTYSKPSPTGQRTSRPPSRQSPSTPPSKAPSSVSGSGKMKQGSQKGSPWGAEDDSRSMLSVQSERYRRHTIGGSLSARDDESLASSPAVPSYMASTESARAKSRLPSPLGLEKNGTPERPSVSSAKKKLSFPASPAGPRRHSGPPRVDANSLKDFVAHPQEKTSNGGDR